MAVSKQRIDWAMLLLRVSIGGLAMLQGFEPLRHARNITTMTNAIHLGTALCEIVCGALILVGVWMIPAVIGLLALIGWPLVHGWIHGAPVLGQPNALFRFLATLAAGLGGAGKWSIGKN